MTNNFYLEQQVVKYFYESINFGVIVIDVHGNVQYINQRCREILNVQDEKVLGRHYNDVFSHVPVEERYTLITLETGREFENIQHFHFYNDGRFFVTDTAILKDGNKVIGTVGIFKDITEIKNVERKLENAIREKERLAVISQMAAGMAHEIKNPLTTIKGFTQLLRKECLENHLSSYWDIIKEEIEQANRVLTDFLQLARPSRPVLKKQSVNSLLEEILTTVVPQALLKNIVVEYEMDRDLPDCMFDRNQIRQVLLNICKNAMEAISDGGNIKIKACLLSDTDEIYIDILDNGRGISQDHLENIGVPFFTTKAEGTGLGLSISYSIIRAHKGRIEVDSQEGKGTRFRIYLPV